MIYNQKLYNREYWSTRSGIQAKHYFIVSEWVKYFMPETMLDYGCGLGQYVKVFRDLEVKAYGFEPSEYAWKTANSQYIFNDIKLINNISYDLVTCLDVLEHIKVDDLSEVLKEIHRLGSKWFLFSICFKNDPNFKLDKTHVTARSREWWIYQLRKEGFFVEQTPRDWQFNWQIIIARKDHETKNSVQDSQVPC